MSQETYTFTMDNSLKKEVDEVCDDIGFTFNTAINLLAKAIAREGKFPFELKAYDPFCSEENLNFLLERIEDVKTVIQLSIV